MRNLHWRVMRFLVFLMMSPLVTAGVMSMTTQLDMRTAGRPAHAVLQAASTTFTSTQVAVGHPVIVPAVARQAPIVSEALPRPTSTSVTMLPVQTMVAAGSTRMNVRRGPRADYARVGKLDAAEQATVAGRYGNRRQVGYGNASAWVAGWVVSDSTDGVPQVEPPAFPPPQPTVQAASSIPAPADPATITEARWIDVDLSEQQLTAYEGSAAVRTILVSTGKPGTPTPLGQYRIWTKLRYDDMAGPGYYLPDVPYTMYFYRGYGLHGTYWHSNFGHPMSHGCVNLPTEEAEWLFGWAEVGTLVNIHE